MTIKLRVPISGESGVNRFLAFVSMVGWFREEAVTDDDVRDGEEGTRGATTEQIYLGK